MAEIFRDVTGKAVTLDVANAVINSVEFYRGGVKVGDAVAITNAAPVPYAVTHEDGPFLVKWGYTVEGNTYTRYDEHEVVTPLFTPAELKSFNSNFESMTDAKVNELEALVRKIIEGATGQRFGYRSGSITVYGTGNGSLRTTERVISADGYRITGNGFTLRSLGFAWNGDTVGIAGPIYDPRYGPRNDRFTTDAPYTITGEFGWLSVPNDVKQAALLLAEEFSCKEAAWRDRYLVAISAADWRFQFDPGAFAGTGSVAVDKLLEKYSVISMAII